MALFRKDPLIRENNSKNNRQNLGTSYKNQWRGIVREQFFRKNGN